MAVQDNTQLPTWNFAAKQWETPATGAGRGGTGDQGKAGTNGASHWSSDSTPVQICDTKPTDGGKGGDGKTPDKPPRAANGRPSGTIRQDLGVCKGTITIWYGAGDGQIGGAGGQGGAGGAGGQKGSTVGGCTPTTTQDGAQGTGGRGGDGGDGGDGGTTQPVTVYYIDAGATFNVLQVGCGGGAGGPGGPPGPGTGDLGSGQTGTGGNPSTAPTISFIKKN